EVAAQLHVDLAVSDRVVDCLGPLGTAEVVAQLAAREDGLGAGLAAWFGVADAELWPAELVAVTTAAVQAALDILAHNSVAGDVLAVGELDAAAGLIHPWQDRGFRVNLPDDTQLDRATLAGSVQFAAHILEAALDDHRVRLVGVGPRVGTPVQISATD